MQIYQAGVGLPIERIHELCAKFPNAVFERYGGVLRVKAGDLFGRGGQIVAHLQDSPTFSAEAMSNIASGAGSVLATSFSGVAAVTGVLNLGVSAAGFYFVNKKLNGLSSNLRDLQSATLAGFTHLDSSLARLEGHILDVKMLLQTMESDLGSVRAEIDEIGRLLDAERFARLANLLELIDERRGLSDRSQQDRIVEQLGELRHYFAQVLEGQLPRAYGLRLVRDLGYFQAWAGVIAMESQFLRMNGEAARADERLQRALPRFKAAAASYARSLLGPDPAAFLHSPEVSPSTFFRRMNQIDREQQGDAKTLEKWLEVRDHQMSSSKISAQQYLDGLNIPGLSAKGAAIERLLGASERLETQAHVLTLCVANTHTYEDWQALSAKLQDQPLHLIPLQRAA